MGIYINDPKKGTTRHYCASDKVIKAIETILQSDIEMVWSESRKGTEIVIMNSDDYDEWLRGGE